MGDSKEIWEKEHEHARKGFCLLISEEDECVGDLFLSQRDYYRKFSHEPRRFTPMSASTDDTRVPPWSWRIVTQMLMNIFVNHS